VQTVAAPPSNWGLLTVAKYSSKTILARWKPVIVYGHEGAETFAVAVSGLGGTATGTVTISAGICTATLSGGKVRCSLSAEKLSVGEHAITVRYNGSSVYNTSRSNTVIVRVIK
jgi:hypothetical protein